VRVLRAVQVGDQQVCACRNHGWICDQAQPSTVEALVRLCRSAGDRRRGGDRRASSWSRSTGSAEGPSRRASDEAGASADAIAVTSGPSEELQAVLQRWAT